MTLPALRSTGRVGRWDPFGEFDDLHTQLERWLASFGRVGTADTTRTWAPLADLSETDEAYLVEVDVPGVRRDDVTIEWSESHLTIQGEVKEKEREGLLRHRTRRVGRFAYRVALPQHVDADRIEANLDEGVLTVRVPKSETNKPRRIAISAK
jgi:HSP20 family protein